VKILFTHSYFLHFDQKQWLQSKPYPPLATLVAAAYTRQQNHEVQFYDVSFQKSSTCIIDSLESFQPDILVIYDDGFNYLTKMCLTNMREAAFEMTQEAVKRNVKVIISSSDSTDHYDDYLKKGAFAVMLGEAEDTLIELIHALEMQSNLSTIKGIAYASQENGNFKNLLNPKRPVRTNLDELPFAAWDLLDIQPYQLAWQQHGYFSMNMATTRGCPFKCNWCAKPIYGNRYNSRSPQKVVEELYSMQQIFHFDHVWFCDDIFGLKPGWVKSFSKALREKGLKLKYKIQSRADLLLEDDTIADLAATGCDEVWIGAESGSQKVLDAMDKGTKVEQIYLATNLMKKYGIHPCFFLQLGYPGEEKMDIDLTIKMLFDLMPFDIGVSVSYPLPGTVFYERVKDQLKDKKNWSDSDDLFLMYQSTFSPEYYKQLHRYIHKQFRARQSLRSLKSVLRGNPVSLKQAFSFLYFFPASLRDKMKLKQLEHHAG
jgi:anaerobic magnesium-protoporphyrin IX monomethyl ester cyclase